MRLLLLERQKIPLALCVAIFFIMRSQVHKISESKRAAAKVARVRVCELLRSAKMNEISPGCMRKRKTIKEV